LVEQRGIEPLTSALRTRRSAKLSYCPTRKSILPFQVSGFKFRLSVEINAARSLRTARRMRAIQSVSSFKLRGYPLISQITEPL
jgi:hypothetical protein